MVTYYAGARRLELELQQDDPVEGPLIPEIIRDQEAFAIVERGIREELAMGKVLSADGRKLLMDPRRDLLIHAPNGQVERVNTGSVYIWCDRICYVISDSAVITAIHVTETQVQTLIGIERVDPNNLQQLTLRTRLPIKYRKLLRSNESGERAKILLTVDTLKTFDPFPSPVWLFESGSLLTMAVIDVWYDGAQLIRPFKQYLWKRAKKERMTGLKPVKTVRLSNGLVRDPINGSIKTALGAVIALPELPAPVMRNDRDFFNEEMEMWWESVRSSTDEKRIVLLLTSNEARSLLETMTGSVGIRSYEAEVMREVRRCDFATHVMRPFGPGRLIDVNFSDQWKNNGRPTVSWSKYV